MMSLYYSSLHPHAVHMHGMLHLFEIRVCDVLLRQLIRPTCICTTLAAIRLLSWVRCQYYATVVLTVGSTVGVRNQDTNLGWVLYKNNNNFIKTFRYTLIHQWVVSLFKHSFLYTTRFGGVSFSLLEKHPIIGRYPSLNRS